MLYPNSRFIYNGPFDDDMPDHYLIIVDFNWWIANEPEIYTWMEQHLPRGRMHHTGMVVSIPDEQDAMLFMLKWS